MFTYNDLLIEILDMTSEERKQEVIVADYKGWDPSDTARSVGEVYRHFGKVYLQDS